MKRIKETWVDNRWRPIMAWAYMGICIFDFVIAPLFIIWFNSTFGIEPASMWAPLTTTAGGIFHISMGTILGATAYTRGQEKMKRIEYDYDAPPAYEEEHEVL